MKSFLLTDKSLLVITGQSGSGKTAAAMRGSLALAFKEGAKLFSLNESTRENIADIIKFIGNTSQNTQSVLFVDNIVLFADDIEKIERACRQHQVRVIGTCRTRDWEGRVSRGTSHMTHFVELPSLSDSDFVSLRQGIIEHAVAPKFLAIEDKQKQLALLRSSRRQLLVLMIEATQQRKFETIIEDEFRSITNLAARAAFGVVGLATIAKNQVTVGELQGILGFIDPAFNASEALDQLQGIVVPGPNGLMGRHETYVRHVFDLEIDAQELKNIIVGFLHFFVQFGQPVILKLGRQRGNLFKFLLNHDWLQKTFHKKNNAIMAERVYSSVEQEYQRDGHYWLQRGLFYRKRRNQGVARDCLEKSIGAYPENLFARHALAQQKMIGATLAKRRTPELERDVNEAIDELNRQTHSRAESDEYPLTTLALWHPEVLVRWDEIDAARSVAREYFERLEAFRKALPRIDKSVEAVRISCLKLG